MLTRKGATGGAGDTALLVTLFHAAHRRTRRVYISYHWRHLARRAQLSFGKPYKRHFLFVPFYCRCARASGAAYAYLFFHCWLTAPTPRIAGDAVGVIIRGRCDAGLVARVMHGTVPARAVSGSGRDCGASCGAGGVQMVRGESGGDSECKFFLFFF